MKVKSELQRFRPYLSAKQSNHEIAEQPRWPFEYSVSDVVEVVMNDETVVYIAEGNQLRYLRGEARNTLDW